MKQLFWIIGVLVLVETCSAAPTGDQGKGNEASLYSILKRLDSVLDDLLLQVEGQKEVHSVEQRNEDGALPEISDLDLEKRNEDSAARNPPKANLDDDDDSSLLQVLDWLRSLRSHQKQTRGDHDIPFP